jgi:hypothetical protein
MEINCSVKVLEHSIKYKPLSTDADNYIIINNVYLYYYNFNVLCKA